jgi:uncharacterized protein (TIGR02172 family)
MGDMEKGQILSDSGRTAQILVWDKNQVLKLFREGFTLSTVKKEEKISQLVYEAGLPVPAIYGTIQVEERYGILFERIDGPAMLEEMMSKPNELKYMTNLLAELHVKTNSIKIKGIRTIHQKLRSQIQKATLLSEKEQKITLTALDRLPKGNTLCHGDFHPGNIIMSTQGPVLIDWVDASQGDYHADVARTYLLYQLAEPDFLNKPELNRTFSFMIKYLVDNYLERYSEMQYLSQESFDMWKLPVAAARLSEGLSKIENDHLLSIVKELVDKLV